MNSVHSAAPLGRTATPVGFDCYGSLASHREPEGGGAVSGQTAERVSVSIDHEAGEGWLFISPDASSKEILAALDELDAAGFEELDYEETGDELEMDQLGRWKIPVVRKWD